MMTAWILAATGGGADEIEDIQPPIPPDLTWPIIGVLVALLILTLLAWRFYPESKRKTAPPPLPREFALKCLEELRQKLAALSLYQLAINVSEVLRRFIEQQYGINAVRQTTPEFLHQAAKRLPLTPAQHHELCLFLKTSDEIKFARVEAGTQEGETLLEQAFSFVKHEH
jgi:hypothetical protein